MHMKSNYVQLSILSPEEKEEMSIKKKNTIHQGNSPDIQSITVSNYLRKSNALIKRIDKDLSEIPEDLRRATVAEILQLLSRHL